MLTLLISETFSQSIDQFKKEASKKGINSNQDVLKELKKRGITENEARRQASLFGISYDEYVMQFINSPDDKTSFGIGFDTSTSFLRYPMTYDSLFKEKH